MPRTKTRTSTDEETTNEGAEAPKTTKAATATRATSTKKASLVATALSASKTARPSDVTMGKIKAAKTTKAATPAEVPAAFETPEAVVDAEVAKAPAKRTRKKPLDVDGDSPVAPQDTQAPVPEPVVTVQTPAPAATQPPAQTAMAEPSVAQDEEREQGGTFEAFGLSEPVMRALAELGFEGPTPVQRDTIPALLAGRDVISQAQTGTGKTAAFGLPIVELVNPKLRRTQSLILAPTRELAVQVAEAIHELGRHRNVQVLPVYGGQPYERQLRGLREGAHVVVGTPGRVLDHLRRGSLKLDEVRVAILDEADEMLNMGFLEDVGAIMEALREARSQSSQGTEDGDHEPPVETGVEGATPANSATADASGEGKKGQAGRRTQVGLFSATLPPPVRQLAKRYLKDPVRIDVTTGQMTVPLIEQVAYEVVGQDKLEALSRVLDVEAPGSAIVFCATRRGVDEVADRMAVRGYRVAALHGDMAQGERERVLRRFRDSQIELLIATDVAARGLDVESVTHVINFDIPWDPGGYVHRIGRTARAGRTGDAITLVTPRDYRQLRIIEQVTKVQIKRKRLPSLADVATRRREAAKESVVKTLAAGDLDAYLTLAGELGDMHDPVEVAAAALRLWDLARNATGTGGEDTATLAGAAGAAAEEAAREERDRAQRETDRTRREEVRRTAAEFDGGGLAPESGMTRLFVGIGRSGGLRPQDLVGAIANEAGLRGKEIGSIDIYDEFAFVEVPAATTARVLEALERTGIRGRPASARIAGPDERTERAPRPPREDRQGFSQGPGQRFGQGSNREPNRGFGPPRDRGARPFQPGGFGPRPAFGAPRGDRDTRGPRPAAPWQTRDTEGRQAGPPGRDEEPRRAKPSAFRLRRGGR